MFQRLIDPGLLGQWLAGAEHTFYECAFSPLITLWYLMFQRLQADHSLDAVVTDAHQGGADALSQGRKPLSQRIRSRATTAFSKARQRLPVGVLRKGLVEQGQRIHQLAQGCQWRGLWVKLLDGSTVRMRSWKKIVQEYPAHRNGQQKRRGQAGYWCLMRVVVSFCARTGVALACAFGAVTDSEQALAVQLLWEATAQELFIGDCNFGIFRIVQVVHHVGAQALLRLTEVRARKLVAGPLRVGREYSVAWAPSRYDKQQPGCSSRPVAGRLLVVRVQRKGFRSQVLYLFTTLTDAEAFPMAELAELYAVRWQVELDLRYLKSQMDLDQLESKSPEMAQKEWLAGLMAYNLVRAVMLAAALEAGLEPLALSFSRARRQVERFLERWGSTHRGQFQAWVRLLAGVACCRLPKRRKPRPHEPRRVRQLRCQFPALVGSRAAARRRCRECVKQN
jgi:hypothetical protein